MIGDVRRHAAVLLAAGLLLELPTGAAAHAADEDPPAEEPVRGGPVLTIPISTEDDAFAMVLVGAVAPQPRIAAGAPLEIEAQFGGVAMDEEVCVVLSGLGCVAVVAVPDDGIVSDLVDLPDDISGAYTVALESAALGSVLLGETIVEAAPSVDAPQPTSTAVVEEVQPGGGVDLPANARPIDRNEDGIWAVLIGAIGVILIGLIGIRDRRRGLETAAQGERLASLDLPTATQLPDRTAQRTGGVAARTRPLAPGEGFVLVALERDEDTGVGERRVARFAELEDAMHGAREEAKHDPGGVMWWEVRRDGSTLPVWIIEGKVTPVASEGPVGGDS